MSGGALKRQRVPLGGCDCYLLALEDHMILSGQGRHVGVTVLEMDRGFSLEKFSRSVERFTRSHPLLGAKLRRGISGSIPHWIIDRTAKVEIEEHAEAADCKALIESLLCGDWQGFLRFDILPTTGGFTVLMSWSHLLFDARGVELALAEIASLAANEEYDPPPRCSWNVYEPKTKGFWNKLAAVRPFVDRYYELKRPDFISLSPQPARSGKPRCEFVHFTKDETERIEQRAKRVTEGIFVMPYFLAIAMRAHAAVLERRGIKNGSFQFAISTQGRKRGARDPIFQNQVAQLFFVLSLNELKSLTAAAGALQEQFSEMTKKKVDIAFLTMVNWMRRLPLATYRRFLQRSAGGNITSLFHAHTGDFLPTTTLFCGAKISNGWHTPSVSQPPGTGIFFSKKNGQLTMSFSWREGAVTKDEVDVIFSKIKSDLLNED